jgi:hypothetical protein
LRAKPSFFAFFAWLSAFGIAVTASGYVLEGQRWFSSPVTIQMNLSATSYRLQSPPAFPLIDRATSWESVYSTSAAIWNQYMANLQIVTVPSNNANGGQSNDSVNEAFFASSLAGSSLDVDTLGLTVYTYNPTTNAMIEADTAFNQNVPWNSYRGPLLTNGVIDFRRVAIHELGHIIGLNHPDQAGQNVQAIMNSVISNTDTVTADDIAGAQALYGAANPVVGTPAILTVPNPPDFDGDGKQDFLWRNTATGQVGIWLMNGSGPKAAANLGSPPLSWVIINTGDFDGKGKSDILWQLVNTTQYGVWYMNGTQIAGIQNFSLPSYAGQICCVADFDSDGLADLVSFNRSAGAIYFWKNSGSLRFVLETSYTVPAASGWLPLGAARLNGASAAPAVVWRNANTGEIAAWFMTSFVWTSVASFGNPGGNVALTGFGDFSGDGREDMLLFNVSNNVVGYWLSNDAQQPTSVPLARVPGTWTPVGAANLNGTSNAEIIWRQTSTGALGAWQVSGSSYSVSIGSLLVGAVWELQPQGLTP